MGILFRYILVTLGVVASAEFIDGVSVDGLLAAAIAGVAMLVAYKIIKPILKVLTLPINLITFGLFAIVLNGLMFWLVGEVISGFHVSGFVPALFGSIIISVLSWIADKATKDDD